MFSIHIYLDNAATTRLDPSVYGVICQYLTDDYANPNSAHKPGQKARNRVEIARQQCAALLGCGADDVVFTSGAAESNSMVFAGLKDHLSKAHRRHIIISAQEHESVIKAAEALAPNGFSVTKLSPDHTGVISAKTVCDAIQPNTGLVSVMYVNNETGAINDIAAIGQLCHSKGILFHSDCVQAAGMFPIRSDAMCLDFATISAHKIHGPKGAAALYVRNKQLLSPLVHGSFSQEFGLRGGTENVAAIAGFGVACSTAISELDTAALNAAMYKQVFYQTLTEELQRANLGIDIQINGPKPTEPGKILNISFPGVDAQTLLLMLSERGVYVSAGSACHGKSIRPSHVLLAMGCSPETAASALRFSFSKYTTISEAKVAGIILAHCLQTLCAIQAGEVT